MTGIARNRGTPQAVQAGVEWIENDQDAKENDLSVFNTLHHFFKRIKHIVFYAVPGFACFGVHF
jgi:hypothetical protein